MAPQASVSDPILKSMPTAEGMREGTFLSERAVSWSAVFAGAAAAAALSLILLMLGVGLGLSSVSPWTQAGLTAGALGLSTIAWLTVTQLLASGAGGYLAGRLRARAFTPHLDEAYFRDTAHGFLTWAVATLATAALLGSALSSIVGTGVQAGASVAGGAVQAGASVASGAVQAAGSQGMSGLTQGNGEMLPYFVDLLFRDSDVNAAPSSSNSLPPEATQRNTAEALRIFGQAFSAGNLNPEDTHRLGQLVARQTGMSQEDAEKRVTSVYDRAQTRVKESEQSLRNMADEARKLSARTTLWMFISLLIGAFVASLMATYGGRHQRAA